MKEDQNGEAITSATFPMPEGRLPTLLKLQQIKAKLIRGGHHDLAADLDRRFTWYRNRRT